MKQTLRRLLYMVLAGVMSVLSDSTNATDPLIFVSAFAPGDRGAIHAYQLDTNTGQLNQTRRTTDAEHPFFMALSPNRSFLYSIHAHQFGGEEDDQIAAYRIMGDTGELKLLNRHSAHGTAACYLDVDATGKSLFVANYSSGSVASFPIQNDGSIGDMVSFFEHTDPGIRRSRQQVTHAHSIVVSPNNRFVYAADLAIDQVLCYRLNPDTAQLLPGQQPFVRTPKGAGPRHLTFHPDTQHMFVINETGNTVTSFNWNPDSGMLIEQQTISTIPDDFTGTSHTADLKITPDGRYLYATNRGHDSIAAYRLDKDRQLTLVDIVPSLGKGPQNLAITTDGRWLMCANMTGNNVLVFRIDTESGTITPADEPIAIPSPSCIMIY
ncbi:MAG: lactonase family protein [Fuerstiella sp.]|nr:lactonase family protein [Fuerstiella sp.]